MASKRAGIVAVVGWCLLSPAAARAAGSYYPVRLDDPAAVYLTPDRFPVHGDGRADDGAALQAAIDAIQESTVQGIVFVPSGRYRLATTINVWPGIRVIGYGATRPVFVLGDRTPGYGDPAHEKYLFFFAGARRGNGPPPDANPGTFYSALSNVDVEIGDGNPGAVGIRGKYAQHCFLAHMDLRIGSGLAGVHDTGNVMEDVHFHGGAYGLWTARPSPGWQLTLVDTSFERQRVAAIRDHEAGLTLVRPRFQDVPAAIDIDAEAIEELWIKDGRFERIAGPAVTISMERSALTQINMEGVTCREVPVFAAFRESGRRVLAPGALYHVARFAHGLAIADAGARGVMEDVFDATPVTNLPGDSTSDLPPLPPAETWVNIRTLGARGDGSTDDTDAFRRAIAQHRAIYLPSGHYVVSGTVSLGADTALIGLHPSTTEIVVPDRTPAFQGVGAPVPVIEAPAGGRTIVIGVGVYTGGINPRAVGVKWRAGAQSMMNDVRLLGGHGTNRLDGSRENPYNNTHTADPELARRWDGQYPSLWVTDGGGGTFFDIWTPSTFAQAGMVVSNTATEGRIYQISSEHHVRHEVQFHGVSHWRVYALQTEEERGESGAALPVEIDDCHDLTLANYFAYRVISSVEPFPWAIAVSRSSDIRLRNVHVYSNSKVSFDDAVYDRDHDAGVRQREFASLTLGDAPPPPAPPGASAVLEDGAHVERLAGGFYDVSGGAAAPDGSLYVVDAHRQQIVRWDAATRRTSVVADTPLDPVNVAVDRAGTLMVVSYAGKGTVYTLTPGGRGYDAAIVPPSPTSARPSATLALPAGDWRVNAEALAHPAAHYVSPDGSMVIPAGQDFLDGATSWGVKSSGQIRSFGLAPVRAGERAFITDEASDTTLVGTVGADGSVGALSTFAYEGGEGTAVDDQGDVYIAAGNVEVFDASGRHLETIHVPERPLQLVFGGVDGRTLFIPARTSVYAVRLRVRGREWARPPGAAGAPSAGPSSATPQSDPRATPAAGP
jgi:sugar lactone lactonase YvrE